jgi:DNA invertase Pin-like site-specific DNA recombinase
MQSTNEKLGIYTRQSKDNKKDSMSIADQIERGENFAHLLGIEFKLYNEGSGRSAAYENLDNRPAMQALLGDIHDDEINMVWALDEARISRNEATKLVFKSALRSKGVILHTDKEGKVDFNDLNDEFFSGMRTLIAQQYVRTISKNVSNQLLKNAREGRVMGGLLKPLGYKKGDGKLLVLDETEVPIVKEIFRLYLEGYGTPKIAQILNINNVPTKGSKYLKNGLKLENRYTKEIKVVAPEKIKWAGNTILSILKNPIYIGKRVHKGVTVKSPSIISQADFDLVQKKIQENKHKGGKITHQYLLNDLCFCGRCNSSFRGRTRVSKRDHIYYCSSKRNNTENCGIRSINIDYLNNVVWNLVINSSVIAKLAVEEVKKISDPKEVKRLEVEKKKLLRQITSEEEERKSILQLYKKGKGKVISIEEAEQSMLENSQNIELLYEKIKNLQSKIDYHNNTVDIIDDITEFKKQLDNLKNVTDFNTQCFLVKLFVERIIINFDDKTENFNLEIIVKYRKDNNRKIKQHIKLNKAENSYEIIPSDETTKWIWGKQKVKNSLPPSSKVATMSHSRMWGQVLFSFTVYINAKRSSNRKSHWYDSRLHLIAIDGAI